MKLDSLKVELLPMEGRSRWCLTNRAGEIIYHSANPRTISDIHAELLRTQTVDDIIETRTLPQMHQVWPVDGLKRLLESESKPINPLGLLATIGSLVGLVKLAVIVGLIN